MPPHKKAGLCAQGKQMNCLIDIDGTLLSGSEPLPSAVDFIRAEGLIPVSVGNIPLWGEIMGIKPECNSLAERTIPRTLCVGVRSLKSLTASALTIC